MTSQATEIVVGPANETNAEIKGSAGPSCTRILLAALRAIRPCLVLNVLRLH